MGWPLIIESARYSPVLSLEVAMLSIPGTSIVVYGRSTSTVAVNIPTDQAGRRALEIAYLNYAVDNT
jgi:hypothetical protein